MFTEETIQYVKDLVGWDTPADVSLIVQEDNLVTLTGRIFKTFHPLSIVENIVQTALPINPSDSTWNNTLREFKTQGALEILNKIFDNSKEYDTTKDYQDTIEKYNGLIAEAYGRSVVVSVLRMMLHTTRINATERQAKFGMIQAELEGYRDEYGRLLTDGAISKLEKAINKAKEIIFPETIDIYVYEW